ncbi:hypothetical protein SARC_10949 [Sphaeroforma arctica JP610]|uniref:nucleoside-diphosphate kinase n=1 Tax=Sphaeroforma arctica JP610 TaxID=667725 RepID=A0A0L0FKL3_9EUKA|nr:hypothetical protein SARC_10949 [Sphaeroforma arctica JP610]KNC76558.1 hypothetical protein SARC_10949 [Sphaeroforma arctica JP610]|eukprot:XP_014150460.1 hypothetical protein SARC_10949 [Sphaeroforma arctica JP610]
MFARSALRLATISARATPLRNVNQCMSTVRASQQNTFARGSLIALTTAVAFGAASVSLIKPAHAEASLAGEEGGVTERTFMAIKYDAVQRGLISEIMGRMEKKGYKLVALKMVWPTEEFAGKHYHDLKERPFFGNLVKFMSSGPAVAMVWEGPGVIKMARTIIGATDPLKSNPGTIRGDLATSVGRNVIHGSDAYSTAEEEIALWFSPSEIHAWNRTNEDWISSNN